MFEKDKENMRQMKPAEKAGYIWDYYKIPLIGITAVIALAVYFLFLFLRPSPEPVLSVEVLNSQTGIGEGTEFCTGFRSFAGIDSGSGTIQIMNQLFFDLSKESDYASTYYMKLLAEIDAGTVDAVISGWTNIDKMGTAGYFLDLKDSGTSHLYQEYQDRILTVTSAEGEVHPIAFDLSDSSVLSNAGIVYTEKACLAVSPKAKHMGNVEKLLEFLYSEKK